MTPVSVTSGSLPMARSDLGSPEAAYVAPNTQGNEGVSKHRKTDARPQLTTYQAV